MNSPGEKDTLETDDFDFLEEVDDEFSTDTFIDSQDAIDADNDCGDACKI
ncbi:hypothetical protein [Aestuariirhabdus sp. LZHN29]